MKVDLLVFLWVLSFFFSTLTCWLFLSITNNMTLAVGVISQHSLQHMDGRDSKKPSMDVMMTCPKGKGVVLDGSSRTEKGRNNYGTPCMTNFVCVTENLEASKWSEGGRG